MSMLPFDDRDGVIWFDGALVPWRDARVHVLTHGLHYASCVFEGERVYNGSVFKLAEHSARLVRSAELLGFTLPYSAAALDAATRAVVHAQGIVDGYVRPVAWRGSEMMGVAARHSRIHVAIACWPWPSYFSAEARENGVSVQISRWARPAPNTAPTESKAAGLYMICTMSKHAAEEAGFQDALMLDWRGRLAEATGANLFLVQGGRLHTPAADCFLDGITRRTVIGLARARGIEVVERAIMPDELAATDEVFLTGTAAELTPVSRIEDKVYGVGPITRQVADDYAALVRRPAAAAAAAEQVEA